jgi:hypothetical protein
VIVLPEPNQDGTLTPGFCRCHQYRISHEQIGRVSESENKPLSYCNRFVGFDAEKGWIPLLETLEEAYKSVDDSVKKKYAPKMETPQDLRQIMRGK